MKFKHMVLLGVVFLFAIGGCDAIYQLGTVGHVDVEIDRKEAVSHGESTKYLIYPEKGEPLQNEDALFHGKFNSSTVYGEIEKGKCYRFKVYGWRVPFLSMYKNIVRKREIKCGEV